MCIEGELLADHSSDGKSADLSGYYLIPGLTDVHFHGAKGHDFSDADPEGLQVMADYELSRGVTQICPAGMTLLEEQLIKVCKNAAQHRKNSKSGALLCGVNLEGPSPGPRRAPRTAIGSMSPMWPCSAAWRRPPRVW